MKQGGLLFPKEPVRKKRKKHHKSIIDRDIKGQCFICGKKSEQPCNGLARGPLKRSAAAGINSRKYLGKTIWRMNR